MAKSHSEVCHPITYIYCCMSFLIAYNGEVINCPLGLLLQNVKSRFNGFVFNNKNKKTQQQ